MPLALDQSILALMNDTVSWEHYTGQDGHGDPVFDPAVTVKCWIEERGFAGGILARRTAHADTFEPYYDIYFDATDANVQTFDLRDRFTVTSQPSGQHPTQPDRILEFRDETGAGVVTLVTL